MTSLSIPDQGRIVALFDDRANADSMIEVIQKEVEAFNYNVSTKKGRDEIKSFAHRIAKIKVAIDNSRKAMTKDMKDKCKIIDADGKHMFDRLAELQEKAKKSLTKYESELAVKQEKVNQLYDIFADAHDNAAEWIEYTSQQMDELITKLVAMPIDRDLFESDEDYEKVKGDHGLAAEKLGVALIQIKHKEAGDAELAQLRKEKEEREAADAKRIENERIALVEKERQERIEAEKAAAVLKATADAEKAANDARIEAERKVAADKQEHEQHLAKVEADKAAHAAHEKAEAQKEIDQANADKEAAEKHAKEVQESVDFLKRKQDEQDASRKQREQDESELRQDWHDAICLELSNMALTDVADGIINGDFSIAKMITE